MCGVKCAKYMLFVFNFFFWVSNFVFIYSSLQLTDTCEIWIRKNLRSYLLSFLNIHFVVKLMKYKI